VHVFILFGMWHVDATGPLGCSPFYQNGVDV